MAEAKAGGAQLLPRPLSPHLQIFRPYVNMMMSIVHRVTGAANYVGSLLVVIWLVSAAMGDAQYNAVTSLLGSLPGLVILFGYTWSVMHHMMGGVRHIIWDAGHGYSIGSLKALSWLSLVFSLALTAAIWAAAFSMGVIHV